MLLVLAVQAWRKLLRSKGAMPFRAQAALPPNSHPPAETANEIRTDRTSLLQGRLNHPDTVLGGPKSLAGRRHPQDGSVGTLLAPDAGRTGAMSLLVQILLLLAAAGIGFALGWLVWRRRSSHRWTQAEQEWQGKLTAAEEHLDSAGLEHRALEDAIAIATEELASLKPEGSELRAQLKEIESASSKADADLQALAVQRSDLLAQVDEMESALTAKDADLGSVESEGAGIRSDLEALEGTLTKEAAGLDSMRSSHKHLQDQIGVLSRSTTAATTELETLTSHLSKLQTRVEELDDTLTDRGTQLEDAARQRTGLQDRLEDIERMLAETTAETEAFRLRGSDFRTRLEAFEQTHEEQMANMETERTRRSELDRRLEGFERDLETMDTRLDARESERAAARQRTNAAGPSRPKDDSPELLSEPRLRSVEQHLAEPSAKTPESNPNPHESELRDDQVSEGEDSEATTIEETLASLQARSDDEATEAEEPLTESPDPALKADDRTSAEIPVTPTPVEVPEDDHEASDQVAAVSRFALPLDAQSDDLKALPSIGALTARMLKSMNIVTFQQIASFTPEDIEVVATALNQSPERIERNDWVGNAKRLHFEKYGEQI